MNSYEKICGLLTETCIQNIEEANKGQKTLGGLAMLASLGLGGLAGMKTSKTSDPVKPTSQQVVKKEKAGSLPSISARTPAGSTPSNPAKKTTQNEPKKPLDYSFPKQVNPERTAQLKKDIAGRRTDRLEKREWDRQHKLAGGTRKVHTFQGANGQSRDAVMQLNAKGKWDFHSWK
jgi:hypothetical protein|tara:strand:- start:548 stop:1075 length:528 start_codon:yes stop_codon:yes gene_type:complete